MEQAKQLSELRKLVQKDPGCDQFVELAKLLAEKAENRPEAREVCLRGLTENPKSNAGRLLLARLYYLDGMTEFCIRELAVLQANVQTPSLTRLLESFGDVAAQHINPAKNSKQNQEAKSAQPAEQPKPMTRNVPTLAEYVEEAEDEVVGEIDLDDEFLEVLVDLEDD